MAQKDTTANVDLDVDGSGVNKALAGLQNKIVGIQNSISAIFNNSKLSAKQIEDSISKMARDLQRASSQMRTLQGNAEMRGVGPTTQLRVQKELNAARAREYATEAAANAARIESATKLNKLRAELNTAKPEERRALFERIELERAYGRELTSRGAEFRKLSTEQKAEIRKQTELRKEELRVLQAVNSEKVKSFSAKEVKTEKKDVLARNASNIAALQTATTPEQQRMIFGDLATDKKLYSDLIAREKVLGDAVKKRTSDNEKANKTARKAEVERLEGVRQENALRAKGFTDIRSVDAAREASMAREYTARNALINAESGQKQAARDRLKTEQDFQKELTKTRATISRAETDTSRTQREEGRTRLQTLRTLAANEVRQFKDLGSLEADRTLSLNRRQSAMTSLQTASVRDQKGLNEIVKTEDARLRLLAAQERIINRNAANQERQARRDAQPQTPASPPIFGQAGAFGVLARTAGYAAAGTAIYAIAGAAQSAVQFTTELEEKLAKLGAISGASGGQMIALSETILGVARNSAFSTAELVDASTTLAQAGFSVAGITDALAAASKLSLAAGTTMAEGVDVLTSAIGAFQLQEDEAGRVADGLTAALNRSKLTIQQVALGIQYAGTTAYEQNINFQELTAIMGAMAQAGIRSGSTMGTGLRQLLVDLQRPSEKLSTTLRGLGLEFKDVDVSTLGATQVFRNLAAAGFNSAEAYGSLETRAAAAYLVVKNNLPFVEEMQLAQTRTGTATEAAAKAADSLNAQWQRQKNILGEGASRVISSMTDALKDWLRTANDASTDEYVNALRKQAKEGDQTSESISKLNRTIYEHLLELKDAADITDRYSAELDKNQTAFANSSDAVAKQQTKLESLSEATTNTIAKQAGLKDGSSALAVETISLGSRFEGLAKYIDTSTNSVAGLISAMQQLRGEEAMTLSGQLQTKQFDLSNSVDTKSQVLGDLVASFKKSKSYKTLPEAAKTRFDTFLANPYNETLAQAAGDELLKLPQGSAGRVRGAEIVNKARDVSGDIRTAEQVSVARGASTFRATKPLQTLETEIAELNKPGTTAKSVESMLQKLTDKRNRAGITRGEQAAYDQLITKAQALLGSKGSFTPPKEEKTGTTREKGLSKTNISIYDLQREAEAMGGRDSIRERVGVKGTGHDPNGGHQNGDRGRAFDFSMQGGDDTLPDIIKKQTEFALRAQKLGYLVLWRGKSYNPDGTITNIKGKNKHFDHVHVEQPVGGAYTKDGTENRAYEEEQGRELSSAKSTARLKVTAKKADLKTEIDDLGGSVDEQAFEINKQSVLDSQKLVIDALKEQAILDTKKMDLGEIEEYNAALDENIKQLVEGTADEISGKLQQLVERIVDNAARAVEQGLRAAQGEITRAEGKVAGLDRMAAKGGFVPDYVRSAAENRVTQAKEAYTVQRTALLPEQIAQQQRAITLKSSELETGDFSADEIATKKAAIEDMTAAVENLQYELSGLQISAAAATQIPTTISGNISLAVSEWQRLRGAQKDWAQSIGSEVGPALNFLEGGLNDMFNNIASGSRNLLQAFGDMVKGIIKYIQQLVIKIIATKIIELLGAIIGGSIGGPTSVSGPGAAVATPGTVTPSLGPIVLPPSGLFNGGPAPKGYAGGGRVANGYPGRDSVTALLAQDEFVVRSAAVKSVGNDFMNDLNKNGARALRGTNQLAVLPGQAKQETNVYVVKPDAAPAMGPNDVLVTIQEDILRDGATKRLIKHVAQGG